MVRNGIVTLKSARERKATLVWLPHAGGSAAFFQELSNGLPDFIECLAAEYPGRGRRFREPLSDDLTTLVSQIALSFRNLPQGTPIIVFGHSMGARVGFELCRHLRSVGSKLLPKLLVVSACEPLHVERVLPILHRLPDDELVETLMTMSEESLTGGSSKDLILGNLNVIRSDLTLAEMHRFIPFPPLSQDLAVYAGTQDSTVRYDTLPRWERLSTGTTSFRSFEGGHFYMLQHAAEFLAQLSETVTAAMAG